MAIIAIFSISPHILDNNGNDQISIDMCKNKIILILYLQTSVICVIEITMNGWMRNVIYAKGGREREKATRTTDEMLTAIFHRKLHGWVFFLLLAAQFYWL